MPSPTVNTKLAEDDIMEMFNQTLHNGKKARRDDDSDDDSDDESDEDHHAPVITAPTPIPSRVPPVSMLAASSGMVPPTPTPASGLGPRSPMVFQDENAVPSSASNKLNVFSETPAKTPLATRTTLGASSSKVKPFEIFQEDPAADENTPSVKPRAALSSVNIFATPALSEKQPSRRHVVTSIAEEPEDAAEAENDEDVLQRVIEEAQEAQGYELVEEDEAPRRQRRFQIHEMTPITERTCEFTSYGTTLRSSTHTSRRISAQTDLQEDEEEEDEEEAGNDALQMTEPIHSADLRTAEEERIPRGSTSPTALFPPSHSGIINSADASFDRSGSPTTPFTLPDGFTIHQTGGSSMILADRTATMHTSRDDSAEPDVLPEASAPTAPAGDEVLSNPCNPSDDEVVATLLSQIEPPLSALSAFHDSRSTTFSRLDALQKHAKSKTRRGSTASRASNAGGEDFVILELGGRKYEIWDKIGEGGYGAVFLAVDVAARALLDAKDDDEDEDSDDEEDDECFVAIKVEKPASVWETVILDRIYSRLSAEVLGSIIKRRDLYAFADESYLLLDFSPQGTLLDLVNKATSLSIAPATGGGVSAVDELIAIFFIIELLRTIESLHSAGFIHGDLKIDNCLVRLEPVSGGASAWAPQYSRSGEGGWNKKGMRLIDFGRGIDLSLYPAGEKQRFMADWKVDERDCVEMREGREWSWETDYFGLAGVAYCMLFGKYISTEKAADGKCKIDAPLKRVCPLPQSAKGSSWSSTGKTTYGAASSMLSSTRVSSIPMPRCR